MTYIKSGLIGLAGAIIAAILWIVGSLVFPIATSILIGRMASTGSAGIGAVGIGEGSVLLAALVGFVVAAGWAFRRSRVVR